MLTILGYEGVLCHRPVFLLFAVQFLNLFSRKRPLSDKLTINVAELKLILLAAKESLFLNTDHLAGFVPADCLPLFGFLVHYDVFVFGNDDNEVRQ